MAGRTHHWRGRNRQAARQTRVAVLTEALMLSVMVLAVILILRPGTDAATAAVEPARVTGTRLEGLGRVVDGDTLDVGSVRVRLHGIDAFERDQTCDRPTGNWACGRAATQSLRARAEGRHLVCEVVDTDRYGRKVSRCEQGGVDVAAALVAEGLALAYRRYSQAYVDEESAARARRLGGWDGSFDRPEQWRRGD